jgi:sulfotransferase family protein
MIVLLACFPKSGSTYVSDLIAAQPSFERAEFTPYYGRREQELEAARIEAYKDRNCVAQHHVRASEYTLHLIQHFQIRPIVLVRNLADALVSLADHIVNEGPQTPVAYFDERFQSMSDNDRLAAVGALAAPWYVNFYVSWYRAFPKAIVRYEDVVLDGKHDLLFDHIGLVPTINQPPVARRFNKGVAGRGAVISDRLLELFKFYPDVDFGPIHSGDI